MCRSFLFNLSHYLSLPHLILCCLDLFVSPLSSPLNTMCCLAPVFSTITLISSSKELDFFLLVHGLSWLNPRLCWLYIRGNHEAGDVSCRLEKIKGAEVTNGNSRTGLSEFFMLSSLYRSNINNCWLILLFHVSVNRDVPPDTWWQERTVSPWAVVLVHPCFYHLSCSRPLCVFLLFSSQQAHKGRTLQHSCRPAPLGLHDTEGRSSLQESGKASRCA